MGRYFLLLAVLSVALLFNLALAGYWFQFGVRGGITEEFNQGANIEIQTITPQDASTGSPAFWVGEDLANGAFLQIGYLVVNQTGSYPSYCSVNSGCAQYENINQSQAEWFYEYFPQGYYGSDFLGAIGPAGSAGKNATINAYGFYYNVSKWDFLFNGNVVGSVNLGNASSGFHTPVAFGELANASNNKAIVSPVIMQNLSVYKDGKFVPAQNGYAYVGFGSGSQTNIPEPYGVVELDSRVNYFQVGSGLPVPQNGTNLWTAGYYLAIKSQYGNLTSKTEELVYSKIRLSTPRVVNVGNGERAVFIGWEGSGFGSYSGQSNTTTISIESNISEVEEWQLQYYLDTSSDYGTSTGTGWYNANATVYYGLNASTIYNNGTSRNVFQGWRNGSSSSPNGSLVITKPTLLGAIWQRQYFVNATSDYGNVSGGGWQAGNATDILSVSPLTVGINSTSRLAFYSWSNGNQNSSLPLYLTAPVKIHAAFRKQYLYEMQALDGAGNRIQANGLYANGKEVNNTGYFFSGQTYNVTQVNYKGVWIPVSESVIVDSSGVAEIKLPVYSVEVTAKDIFGIPIDAAVSVKFSNGTIFNGDLGSGGSLIIPDVPYGDATGVAQASVFTSSFQSSGGVPVNLIFVTPFDILVFLPVMAVAALIYLYSSRKLQHQGPH